MKVLVFEYSTVIFGMEAVIMNYYRHLDRTRVQFDFLCNTEIVAHEQEILSLGGTIYRIPARSKDRKAFSKALDNFFKTHASEYKAIWFNTCSLANIDYLKKAKQYGIPTRIIHCHNAANGDSFLRGCLHKFNRTQIRKYATDFWTCSEDANEWFFGKNAVLPNYKLINNAVDVNFFKPNEEIRQSIREELNAGDKVVLGHTGRFHFQKNHPYLLKVFNALDHKYPGKYMLILIGDGEDKEALKNQVKEYGIEEDVKFLGIKSNVSDYIQAMDQYIFPSRFEGLSVALLEAEANGLPCMISDTISLASIVNDNVKMFPITDEAVDKWVEAIEEASHQSKHFNIDESNKKVVFRKSKTVLPLWLDKYLFEELGAIYAPKHTRYEYNLDLNEDELKVYLGTYFPRSYAEMFCIFDNMFQNNAVLQVFNDKKELNFFDFCCGTGGELIGLLSAIDKYFPNEKNINIVACDGNNLALDYLHKIIEKAGKLSKHNYKFLPICKEICNLDDIGLLEIPFGSFDIALCDKVCCEFISHGVYNQSYGYLADYLSKKISKDGLFVILDVTTKCEKTKMFYPQMMNLQINNFVRDSEEFETLLPLSCAMYKDCSIPCFTQQTFKVTHMRKKDDESRVCYRILCYKKLKEHLFSNYFVGNKTYVINPIRYQQHADGAYCSNSQANKELIDSFNINN